MIDPRPIIFDKRLSPAQRIVAIGGGKGGVGKSTVATLLALCVSSDGSRVGLLDLDVHGGAAHLFLGIEPSFPDEEGGILPFDGPLGIRFMSAVAFSGERPLALRGAEVTDAIAELLAVTIWPPLDLLLIDLPPGLGESLLDLLRFIPRTEVIAVTTPSVPSIRVADRFLAAVGGLAPVLGVVANMVVDESPDAVAELAARHAVPLLVSVPVDPALEAAVGKPSELLRTSAADRLKMLVPVLSQQKRPGR
jgi:ATP-binding protein involved in chromosome partitioning